jgi:hypothetical protein
MLKLLRGPKDITQAQKKFRERFHIAGAEKRTVRIAHRGEVHRMEVIWLPSEGVWAGSRKLINRYWNVFGVGEPSRRAPNGITCEINFPLHGINRRIAAGRGRRYRPRLPSREYKREIGRWSSALSESLSWEVASG